MESARRKAQDPSDLTSEEGLEVTGRGRRKKKTIIRSSSEESITPPPSRPSSLNSKQKKRIRNTNRTWSTSTESCVTPPPSPPSNTAILNKNNEQYLPVQQVENVQEINYDMVENNLSVENMPIVIAGRYFINWIIFINIYSCRYVKTFFFQRIQQWQVYNFQ